MQVCRSRRAHQLSGAQLPDRLAVSGSITSPERRCKCLVLYACSGPHEPVPATSQVVKGCNAARPDHHSCCCRDGAQSCHGLSCFGQRRGGAAVGSRAGVGNVQRTHGQVANVIWYGHREQVRGPRHTPATAPATQGACSRCALACGGPGCSGMITDVRAAPAAAPLIATRFHGDGPGVPVQIDQQWRFTSPRGDGCDNVCGRNDQKREKHKPRALVGVRALWVAQGYRIGHSACPVVAECLLDAARVDCGARAGVVPLKGEVAWAPWVSDVSDLAADYCGGAQNIIHYL